MTKITKNKTFVYENIEVVFTGRTATKQLRKDKVDTIYEIKPKDIENGSWKKWVRENDLYEIID